MPLLFVLLKHRLHLVVQASVDLRKLRGDILMHSDFHMFKTLYRPQEFNLDVLGQRGGHTLQVVFISIKPHRLNE